MDELTLLIKQEIKKQFRSVRQFAFSVGIAQTTVVSALKNGVSGTGFSTVMKICKALDIQVFDYSIQFRLYSTQSMKDVKQTQ